jgi:hypothetical protein
VHQIERGVKNKRSVRRETDVPSDGISQVTVGDNHELGALSSFSNGKSCKALLREGAFFIPPSR